jgi:hypothetical protein
VAGDARDEPVAFALPMIVGWWIPATTPTAGR